MQSRFVFILLLTIIPVGWSQEEGTQSGANCETLYNPDDPALFEFVKTRKQVDYERYADMTIAGIQYIILPIFNENDPDEDVWLYRLANRLHINTRIDTLKRQLIFDTGTRLQPKKISENERLLRNNNYLVDAMILPQKVCGNEIYLLVVVREVWTLTPAASASRTGGENTSYAGLTENNLLGTGQIVSVGYFDDADRSGTTFFYSHPNFFGRHTELSLGYQNNSDGDAKNVSLIRPFFELDAEWSAGIEWYESNQIETIKNLEEEINAYRSELESARAFFGWSTGRGSRQDNSHNNSHDNRNVIQRWRAGISSEEKIYSQSENAAVSVPPENLLLRYPWLEWSSIEDNYVTMSNFTHSHRNEDVLVGFAHRINLGYATQQWNSMQDAWVFSVSSAYTAGFGEHHLMRIGAATDGRYNLDDEQMESTFYSARSEYYHFPDNKNRWYAHMKYTAGSNLNDYEKLTAGGGDTLRGYPDDYQRGDRQWVFTLERRFFSNYQILQLAYLGAAAYIDAGRTWDSKTSLQGAEAQLQNDDTLANFGLGLRLSPSRFNVSRVIHLDLAWPLVNRDEVDDYQLIISGRVDF